MHIKEEELDNTDYRELDLPKPVEGFYNITRLLNRGITLRVIDGDKKGNELLIKLDPETEYTILSRDTKEDIKGIFTKRWEVVDISINYLLTYDVYDNSLFYTTDLGLKLNDRVSYVRADNQERDIAFINHIYQEVGKENYLIGLTGDNYLYSKDEISLRYWHRRSYMLWLVYKL